MNSDELNRVWGEKVDAFLLDFKELLIKHNIKLLYDDDDTYFKVDGLYTTDSLQRIMRQFSVKGISSRRLVESIFPFDLKKAKFPLKGLEYRILLDSLMQ